MILPVIDDIVQKSLQYLSHYFLRLKTSPYLARRSYSTPLFMKSSLIFLMFLSGLFSSEAQSIDALLEKYNTRSVPYITVQELKMDASEFLILDTRKKEEYDISHIPNAVWVSEKVTDSTYAFAKAYKDKPVAVYCSVGIRSERYGEQLKKRGFTDVRNVYGSIFAWKDAGYEVVDASQKVTDSVHVFSKVWGKYLKTGTKVF